MVSNYWSPMIGDRIPSAGVSRHQHKNIEQGFTAGVIRGDADQGQSDQSYQPRDLLWSPFINNEVDQSQGLITGVPIDYLPDDHILDWNLMSQRGQGKS